MLHHVIILCVLPLVTSAGKVVMEEGSGEVTCSEYGHVYTEGERMSHTSPCEKPCWCSANGKKQCRHVICEYPACYDAVKVKRECCPRCPNGANCMLDDLAMKQGESMTQSLGGSCSSVCTCIYGGQEPTCILQCDDVPPLEVFDGSNTSPKPSPWKLVKKDKKHEKRPRKKKRRRFSLVWSW